MRYTKTAAKLLAAVLALALLAGCGAAAPADAPATGTTVKVSTVDEFLAAIAPDTTIELAEGDYALYTASNYGGRSGSDYYAWARAYDGPMLEIRGVENLVITGAGADKVTLTAEPRYANVLSFVSCRNVTISQLTAGHTRDAGVCSGGVLRFEDCRDCAVRGCGLFGCGTLGVEGVDCSALAVEDTDVYECSYGAFFFTGCRDTRIVGGEVRDCGRRLSGPAMCLLSLQSCDGVTVSALKVHDNVSMRLLESLYSRGVCFVSNEVRGNDLGYMFFFDTFSPTVDGCAFENNGAPRWYAEGSRVLAADAGGSMLDDEALEAMTLREIDPASVAAAAAPTPGMEVSPGAELTVTTVDEFLEAIGPERTIVLDGASFDLSAASGYGAVNGQYYYWESTYDGPGLVIDGVSGLTIRAAADDPKATTIAAAPRYANVLTFRSCDKISLVGFTAGHTQAPGECSGGVLYFDNSHDLTVDGCRLYGCGTSGVDAFSCTGLRVLRTEIYDCSQCASYLTLTDGIELSDCDIHDVPSPALLISECGDITWNGAPVTNGWYDVAGGSLVGVGEGSYNVTDTDTLAAMTPSELDGFLAPDGEAELFPWPEGGRELLFALKVQKLIADGDWEGLADNAAFPLLISLPQGNLRVDSREDLLASDLGSLLSKDYRARVGAASLEGGMSQTAIGNGFADNAVLFRHAESEYGEDTIRVCALIVR